MLLLFKMIHFRNIYKKKKNTGYRTPSKFGCVLELFIRNRSNKHEYEFRETLSFTMFTFTVSEKCI